MLYLPQDSRNYFFRISQVAEILQVEPYVLRYWEKEFPALSPKKDQRGQRIYSEEDVRIALIIRHLLYEEGYTIEGARKKLNKWLNEGDIPESVTFAIQKQELKKRVQSIKKKLLQIKALLDKHA